MAVLFFTYRYFKQAKPRTEKQIASGFDGYDIIHPIDEARVIDDGLHDVGQMSKETSTLRSVAIAHFPLHGSHLPSWRPRFSSKPWLWHTRDGDQSKEAAAEEGRTSLSPNNLPDSHWDTFLERGRNVFGTVSTLFKVYKQRNTGSVEARPFVAQEDESTKSPPLVTGDPLEIGDRRSPEQTPLASNPTQTTTASSNHDAGSKASENGTEGSVTTTTASPRAHRHKELQQPFPFVPAPRIGSGTAPPSGIDIQGTDPRSGLSRSTTASSDVSSVPSLPLYQHYPNNAEGSTSPTPSSALSAYGNDPLREPIPPVPALPSAEGIATPTNLRAEGERIGLMSSNTLAKGHRRGTSGLASSRTSTMQSTWSDVSSIPSVPSFQRSIEHSEGGSATPTPSSPPSLYGHDWLQVLRGSALFGVTSVTAAPPGVGQGRTAPTANRPLDRGRRPTMRVQSMPTLSTSRARSTHPRDAQN